MTIQDALSLAQTIALLVALGAIATAIKHSR
jgi:hypothetical protein